MGADWVLSGRGLAGGVLLVVGLVMMAIETTFDKGIAKRVESWALSNVFLRAHRAVPAWCVDNISLPWPSSIYLIRMTTISRTVALIISLWYESLQRARWCLLIHEGRRSLRRR